MGRRYAEGTNVTPENSLSEIKKYAELRGAEDFVSLMGPRQGMVRFHLRDSDDGPVYPVQFSAEFPTDPDLTIKQAEQEYARRWRVVLLKVKAAFEQWNEGEESTVTEAFMPHLMLPGGGTVGDAVTSQYEQVARGQADRIDLMPALGPGDPS